MQIGIVGLGLIGGSLAIDLKAKTPHKVTGVSRRQVVCDRAVELQIVDDASVDFSSLEAADLVVLCTPIQAIVSTAERLLPHLRADAVLTDVGSVKQPIVEHLAPLWPNFVGGHPMAGTAHQGLEAAVGNLFVDRPYVLTPSAATPTAAVERLRQIIQPLGCVIYHCDPVIHDQAVAWISHLPVMVSAGLISACTDADADVFRLAQAIASSGFRDTSRVGGGNPELGVMMAQHNRDNLLRSLQTYRQRLDQLTDLIEQEDWQALEAALRQTQSDRPGFVSEL
ncbi:MAG: prephenate/arogenate dehydrogenase [Elainellaceae cyanobacterium]